jgi:hypothetical protein
MLDQPRESLRGLGQRHDLEPQAGAGERAPVGTQCPLPAVAAGGELLGDVGDHPVVGGRGGGEHRNLTAPAESGEHVPDAAVVGTEVMTPV